MKKLEFLIGLPASGKSTYANKQKKKDSSIVILSSDEIRKEFEINTYSKEDNEKVFNILHKRLFDELKKENHHIIYDATNLSKKRFSILEKVRAKAPDTKIEYVFFGITVETCINRDANRENPVGKEVILRLLKNYKGFYEDFSRDLFDKITVLKEQECGPAFIKYMQKAENFNQENYYHTQTLEKHIKQVYERLVGEEDNHIGLVDAAHWHDLGKLYTKTKEEGDTQAHFRGHNSVSSYLYATSVFPSIIERIFLVPSRTYKMRFFYTQAIIENHMDNNLDSKKINRLNKFFKDYGYNLKKDLKIFQKADKFRTPFQKIIININAYLYNKRKKE